MANSSSLQLFRLIKSMSRSEKRYFKIHVRTHSSKHIMDYIELFNVIDRSDAYDEERAVAYMIRKGSTQRFAVLKHRLYEKVLDALEAFQRSSDEVLDLRHELNKAQVLIDRGMEKPALAMLKKIHDRARAIDDHSLSLDAQSRMHHLDDAGADTSDVKGDLDRAAAALYLQRIHKDLEASRRSQGVQADAGEVEQDIESILNPIKEAYTDSPSNDFLWHRNQAALAFQSDKPKVTLAHLQACATLISEHPILERHEPLAKAKLLANMTYCQLRLGQQTDADASLAALLAIEDEAYPTHFRQEMQGLRLQTMLYHGSAHAELAMEETFRVAIQDFETNRWSYPPLLRAGLDYGIGIYHHQRGLRAQALRCLNRILNDGEIRRDEDVYHRSLVLITLLKTEDGDRAYMAHSARALKRYLSPRGLLQGADALLIDYIAGIRRAKSEEGEIRALSTFLAGLEAAKASGVDRIAFEHFDFIAWAQDRLDALNDQGMVA